LSPLNLPRWLLKSEPHVFSYADLVRKGREMWDGVRNHQAKANLAAMAVGDTAFFYHSQTDRAIVGICRVVKAAYLDPTDASGKFLALDIEPVQALTPISLAWLKQQPALAGMSLIKQSRLSVCPITADESHRIISLTN
jgi:predicted RNA-binding protein with PUA-like domain